MKNVNFYEHLSKNVSRLYIRLFTIEYDDAQRK